MSVPAVRGAARHRGAAPRPMLFVVPAPTGIEPLGGRQRRFRRGAALLGVAVLLAVVLVATEGARATGAGERLVIVQPGQTLSHVAVRELPELPMGTAVAELQLANRLNTSHVHAGQVLRIPATL